MKTKSKRELILPILSLSAPIAFSHLANMMMQLVDTLIVGRLGPAAIGATSVSNSIFHSSMVLGIGVLFGMDYWVAHAYGAKKLQECHEYFVQALYIAVFASVPFILLMQWMAYHFQNIGVTSDVALLAKPYLQASSFSLLPLLLFTALRQYLQAMGSALPILFTLILGNLLNALFNWIFIFGKIGFPALGIAGSGYATTLARFCMVFILCIYVLWKDTHFDLGLRRASFRVNSKKLFDLIKLGLPAGIQMLFEVGVFATSSLLVSQLGAIALASHQVVLMIASLMFMIPLGLSSGAAVLVSQALGAHRPREAVVIGWVGIGMGSLFMAFSGIVLYFFADPILNLFTQDAQVIVLGKKLLLVAAFFQLSDGIQVSCCGVLRGIGNTRASLAANFFGHWAIGLPIGYYLCFKNIIPSMSGALGLWVGLSIGLTFVAFVLLLEWFKKSNRIYLEN